MKTFIIRCTLCSRSFELKAFSIKDALRRLGAMTNCLASPHITLPSLLQFIDVNAIEEKKEEKEFQELDTTSLVE